MTKAFAFPEISKIGYGGPKSKNPLAFKYYDADEVVEGKTIREHLWFSIVYWRTFRGHGVGKFTRPTSFLRRLFEAAKLGTKTALNNPKRFKGKIYAFGIIVKWEFSSR
jgi:xylose isomerase